VRSMVQQCYRPPVPGLFTIVFPEVSRMRAIALAFLCLFFLIPAPAARAQDSAEVPLTIQRLSESVLFIRTGASTVMSNVTAISTTEGIVLVDAHYSPGWGSRIREAVETSLERRDFKYVILTHAGVDHMGGVKAFQDAVLVGHDNTIARIDFLHETVDTIDAREGLAPRLRLIQEELDAGPLDASRRVNLEESLLYWRELGDLLASGLRYQEPTITFSEGMTLRLGGHTLALRYCTPGYSQSDAFVYVPEEKLLIVGDIFVKHRIPLLDAMTDLERWRSVFRPFMEGEVDVRHIIGAHGDLLTLDDLKMQLEYLEDLWAAVTSGREEGMTLEEAKTEFSFQGRYPHLAHLITAWAGYPVDLHERNIEQIWTALGGSLE